MKEIKIKKGVRLPLFCQYNDGNIENITPKSVGITTEDYKLFKPKLLADDNGKITPFDFLLQDKKNEDLKLNILANGTFKGVTRGEKRKILSACVEVEENNFEFNFKADKNNIIKTLLESGLFSAFRQRPFDMLPDPKNLPDVIFVNAMDTRPLAYNANSVISLIKDEFIEGLKIINNIAKSKVFVCVDKKFELNISETEKLNIVKFLGNHPAGLVGTHIHHLCPVNEKKSVWYIDFQEVAAIGKLFSKNILSAYRYIAVSDITNQKITVVKAPLGSNILEILNRDLDEDIRIISGNILYGRKVTKDEPFLGRYDYQITILNEMTERKFMEWALPGIDVFSVKNVFLSKIFGNKYVTFDTSMHGSIRPIIPVGSYEKVFPFDIEITHLLRYLSIGDTDMAQKLGCLELGEEDLALCTFVCPGKNDYSKLLRDVLDSIYHEAF
ncbi:NADH:ubiquinone reductase (Na(+)-transporting) subunit A [Deferribacteraceae bacterium V6Fe1]|nr:NADH:ubiquinone reductase (Na(+)-transporting) subunit A [Deferribacteraceae bacterium V6Fe1]